MHRSQGFYGLDYLRNKAREARAAAESMSDPATQAEMLAIADKYDAMVKRSESRNWDAGSEAAGRSEQDSNRQIT